MLVLDKRTLNPKKDITWSEGKKTSLEENETTSVEFLEESIRFWLEDEQTLIGFEIAN